MHAFHTTNGLWMPVIFGHVSFATTLQVFFCTSILPCYYLCGDHIYDSCRGDTSSYKHHDEFPILWQKFCSLATFPLRKHYFSIRRAVSASSYLQCNGSNAKIFKSTTTNSGWKTFVNRESMCSSCQN